VTVATKKRPVSLLSAAQPHRVGQSIERIAPDLVERIDSTLPGALAGQADDLRAYVAAYGDLTDRVLEAVEEDEPGWLRAALGPEAMSIPFSKWVGTYGPGRGTGIALVDILRSRAPGTQPLPYPRRGVTPQWPIGEQDVRRFQRAVMDEIEREDTPLDRIASVLQLNRTDLAHLFGVRRQALDRWYAGGIPADRQPKLATLGAIVDVLARRLKRERIPAAVRRAAPAYGGRTILEAIGAGDEDLVLSELQSAFEWSSGA
jgi:hypothetical protein